MTTFLLIPGAGGQAWYWHRLVPVLQAHGHRAIPVELPTGDERAGLAAYADAVVAAAPAPDDDALVVVAQSMGGLTAPLVCDRLPVRMIVLVNAMVPTPGETGGDYWANTGQATAQRAAAEQAGRLAPGDPDEDEIALFLHDVPDDVRAAAIANPPRQSGAPFGDPWPLPAWPDVPVRAVVGRDDRLFPPDYQGRVLADRLGLVPDEVPGGHLLALANPEGLARVLESYPVPAVTA